MPLDAVTVKIQNALNEIREQLKIAYRAYQSRESTLSLQEAADLVEVSRLILEIKKLLLLIDPEKPIAAIMQIKIAAMLTDRWRRIEKTPIEYTEAPVLPANVACGDLASLLKELDPNLNRLKLMMPSLGTTADIAQTEDLEDREFCPNMNYFMLADSKDGGTRDYIYIPYVIRELFNGTTIDITQDKTPTITVYLYDNGNWKQRPITEAELERLFARSRKTQELYEHRQKLIDLELGSGDFSGRLSEFGEEMRRADYRNNNHIAEGIVDGQREAQNHRLLGDNGNEAIAAFLPYYDEYMAKAKAQNPLLYNKILSAKGRVQTVDMNLEEILERIRNPRYQANGEQSHAYCMLYLGNGIREIAQKIGAMSEFNTIEKEKIKLVSEKYIADAKEVGFMQAVVGDKDQDGFAPYFTDGYYKLVQIAQASWSTSEAPQEGFRGLFKRNEKIKYDPIGVFDKKISPQAVLELIAAGIGKQKEIMVKYQDKVMALFTLGNRFILGSLLTLLASIKDQDAYDWLMGKINLERVLKACFFESDLYQDKFGSFIFLIKKIPLDRQTILVNSDYFVQAFQVTSKEEIIKVMLSLDSSLRLTFFSKLAQHVKSSLIKSDLYLLLGMIPNADLATGLLMSADIISNVIDWGSAADFLKLLSRMDEEDACKLVRAISAQPCLWTMLQKSKAEILTAINTHLSINKVHLNYELMNKMDLLTILRNSQLTDLGYYAKLLTLIDENARREVIETIPHDRLRYVEAVPADLLALHQVVPHDQQARIVSQMGHAYLNVMLLFSGADLAEFIACSSEQSLKDIFSNIHRILPGGIYIAERVWDECLNKMSEAEQVKALQSLGETFFLERVTEDRVNLLILLKGAARQKMVDAIYLENQNNRQMANSFEELSIMIGRLSLLPHVEEAPSPVWTYLSLFNRSTLSRILETPLQLHSLAAFLRPVEQRNLVQFLGSHWAYQAVGLNADELLESKEEGAVPAFSRTRLALVSVHSFFTHGATVSTQAVSSVALIATGLALMLATSAVAAACASVIGIGVLLAALAVVGLVLRYQANRAAENPELLSQYTAVSAAQS